MEWIIFRLKTKWLKFCRNCLKSEIDQNQRLIERLQGYARPHAPELSDDGTDQTYNLTYRLDVGITYIPAGVFKVSSPMVLSSGDLLQGDGIRRAFIKTTTDIKGE